MYTALRFVDRRIERRRVIGEQFDVELSDSNNGSGSRQCRAAVVTVTVKHANVGVLGAVSVVWNSVSSHTFAQSTVYYAC